MIPNVQRVHAQLKIFSRLEKKYRNYVNSNPECIYEIGSLDGTDSISLNNIFKTKIVAFEPTPDSFLKVEKNLTVIGGRAFQFAISDFCGLVEFFVNDPIKTITTWNDGNQGANSLFKNNLEYPMETYFQNSIQVQTRSLQCLIETGFQKPDFLWIDCQGAELKVLKGMGPYLNDVRFIYCELSLFKLYEDQPLADEVINFLNKSGFLYVGNLTFGTFQFDACFVRPEKNPVKAKILDTLLAKSYNSKSKIFIARTPKQYFRMLPRMYLEYAKRIIKFKNN